MGLFEQFPFTNFHDLNLDWLINEIKNITANILSNAKAFFTLVI